MNKKTYKGHFEERLAASKRGVRVTDAQNDLLLDIRDLLIEIRDWLPEKPAPGPSREELLAEELKKRGFAWVLAGSWDADGRPQKGVQFARGGVMGVDFVVFQEPNANWMLRVRMWKLQASKASVPPFFHAVVANGFTDLANVAKHIDLWVTEYLETGKPPKGGDGQ